MSPLPPRSALAASAVMMVMLMLMVVATLCNGATLRDAPVGGDHVQYLDGQWAASTVTGNAQCKWVQASLRDEIHLRKQQQTCILIHSLLFLLSIQLFL